MKKFILIMSILLLAVGCSEDSWSKNEKNEFLEGCETEGGGNFYCKCFMKEMMAAYPNYEDSHNISLEEAVELASKCE